MGPSPLAPVFEGFMKSFGKVTTFLKNVGPRFRDAFKGLSGKLLIITGVITTIANLFQGKDIAASLAQGAGPVLGAALGAALIPFLGPIGPLIGGIIGGWVGSAESVTEPLTVAFRDLGTTVATLGSLLGQIGSDLTGLARAVPGVSNDFDLLKGTLTLLLAPLSLLKLAIYGIYEAYLNIKEKVPGGGLTPEEKAKRDEISKARRTDFAKLQNDLDTRSLKDQIAGVRDSIKNELTRPMGGNLKQQEEYKKSVQSGQAPNSEAYFALQNRLKLLYEKEKQSRNQKTAPGSLSKTLNLPTTPTTTTNIPKDLQKTAQTPAAVKTGTDKTTTAVKELTAKITSQSSLQTSVAAIYNLLASGMLRVQTNMAGMMGLPGAKGLPPPITGIGTGTIPGVENIVWNRAKGGLGDALANEMKMKPPGSKLVIANSSETIIPAANGFIPSQGMFSSSRSGMSSGAVSVSAPITIYQQPGQSTDELASIVALKIGEAVADARAASVFV
jgi:hypothetical protein